MNVFELPKVIEELKTLDKECLTIIFLELLKANKIGYEDITSAYVEYLEMLRKGATEDYLNLQYKVTNLWFDTKKNRDKNLKNIMHYLRDKGTINMTHEQIDKKWNKKIKNNGQDV